jgi:Uma2 family endonuclease
MSPKTLLTKTHQTVTEVDSATHPEVLWTDEAFLSLSRDGHRYEVIDRKLVDMGNSGAKHGFFCSDLMIVLGGYVRSHNLGIMFDSSTAFKLQGGNKRSPDISFVDKSRLAGLQELPDGFLELSPDLVIEVLSPGNTTEEIHNKLVEFFDNGTRLAWVVHPIERYILVYYSAQEPDRLLKSTDTLEGESVVPGFSFPIAELFRQLPS